MRPEYENMDQRDLNDMMAKQAEESGHTTGPITFEVDTAIGRFFAIDSAKLPIAMFFKGREEAKANATIFTEAINVATDSGLTPKQMWEELKARKEDNQTLHTSLNATIEQRNELLEALEYVSAYLGKGGFGRVDAKQHADKAISRAKGQTEKTNGN